MKIKPARTIESATQVTALCDKFFLAGIVSTADNLRQSASKSRRAGSARAGGRRHHRRRRRGQFIVHRPAQCRYVSSAAPEHHQPCE